MQRTLIRSTAIGLASLCGVAAFAADFDPTGKAGRVMDIRPSVVIYGADSPVPVRRWTPWVLDDASSALNHAVVQVVRGRIFGGASSFSSTGGPKLLFSFGTADQLDAASTFSSNDVLVAESVGNQSDTVGDMLPDGSIVFRSNFAGGVPIAQNNLEWVPALPNAQNIPVAIGNEILTGPGLSGAAAGSAFLGIPGALAINNTRFWVGNTNFSATVPADVPIGCNIWLYIVGGGPLAVGAPTYTYTQAGAELLAGIAAGNGRQTQPKLNRVNGVNYVIFGIGDGAVGAGGSARPLMMVVDAYEDADAFTGAVTFTPPAGYRFVDHQATGGTQSPFQNARFSMNDRGQIAIAAESIATPPGDLLLRYDPIFGVTGRIIGYNPPVTIADAVAPGSAIPDTIADGFIVANNGAIPPVYFLTFSGIGINNAGNIAFTGNYDAAGVGRTAVYMYRNAGASLHQITAQLDVITFGPNSLTMNVFPQDASDAFFGPSLAAAANVMAMPFRDDSLVVGDFRGVLVLAFGHIGDVNFDGHVGESDLGVLLGSWQAQIGDNNYDPQADFNNDGRIDEADLGALLGNWNP
ncbi:MAG: hypothetical protein U1D55_14295 [Phycisphaerae bacterium]